jgi:hypothetical protein
MKHPTDSNPVPKRYQVLKLFLQDTDPGDIFEMSEWFEKKKKLPNTETSILVLAKRDNGEIFKAIFTYIWGIESWMTWEEGFVFSGKDITNWAYIRKIDGENRKDVTSWKKVGSRCSMSS